MKRRKWYTFGVAALVVVAAGAGWAFTVILSPAPGVPSSDGYTLVTAVEGDVGAHLTLNVAASWNLSPVGTNEAAGVVTTVDTQNGQIVDEGARLYSVNLRPVVVAQGAVPAYRSLAAGDSGADVAQLQAMLGRLGFYTGGADGTAGASTVAAISRWQASLGLEETGEVSLGDVIFVPALPARLALKTEVVHRGATLGGGEAVVQWLGESPVFTLPVSEAQSAMVSTGTRVVVDDGAGDTWQAVAGGRTETDTGTVVIELGAAGNAAPTDGTSADGDPPSGAAAAGDGAPEGGADASPAGTTESICGDRCGVVPADGQTLFASRVVTVETVHGTVVPSAALRTDAAEQVSLVDATGAVHPVGVSAESQGLSVVTGVDAGLAVRVPVNAAAGQAPAPVPGSSSETDTGSGR